MSDIPPNVMPFSSTPLYCVKSCVATAPCARMEVTEIFPLLVRFLIFRVHLLTGSTKTYPKSAVHAPAPPPTAHSLVLRSWCILGWNNWCSWLLSGCAASAHDGVEFLKDVGFSGSLPDSRIARQLEGFSMSAVNSRSSRYQMSDFTQSQRAVLDLNLDPKPLAETAARSARAIILQAPSPHCAHRISESHSEAELALRALIEFELWISRSEVTIRSRDNIREIAFPYVERIQFASWQVEWEGLAVLGSAHAATNTAAERNGRVLWRKEIQETRKGSDGITSWPIRNSHRGELLEVAFLAKYGISMSVAGVGYVARRLRRMAGDKSRERDVLMGKYAHSHQATRPNAPNDERYEQDTADGQGKNRIEYDRLPRERIVRDSSWDRGHKDLHLRIHPDLRARVDMTPWISIGMPSTQVSGSRDG
ncbi:hypothetical protein C8R44DRAFT_751369 [Mycena epipterygia]|nr:hypothetical protein C8R44DRAFT_751369 [Mycena epipterygia]